MTHHGTETVSRWLAFVAVALVGCATGAAHPIGLLPVRERITDEAIARDRGLMRSWQDRLAAVPDSMAGEQAFYRARAGALLSFALDEYDRANRAAIVDQAVLEAVEIVQALETREVIPSGSGALQAPAEQFAPELWEEIQSVLADEGAACAAPDLARAQVVLLQASEDVRRGGPACGPPLLAETERLIAAAKAAALTCLPPPPIPEPVPVDTVPPAPPPDTVEVRHEIERRVARLPRNVHFAVRQSILSPASRAVLVRAIPLLLEFPHIHLGLEGHTDRRGTSDYNQALAERRAEAVRAYLVAQGVDPERITVDALGSRVPLGLGANKSEEFALDRRVELHFFGSDDVEIEPVGQTDDLQLEQGPR